MIIISHKLFLKKGAQETEFEARIFAPEQQTENSWRCRYEIDWPGEGSKRAAFGTDQLQSLMLALYMIGADINTSNYHKEGRLRAYEHEKGYGFPVMGVLRDLLEGSDRIGL